MINVDGKDKDMFLPHHFDSFDKDGKKTDLMNYFSSTKKLPKGKYNVKKPKALKKVNLKTNWKSGMPPK